MGFEVTRDPEQFRDRAWPFIETRLECNVVATVLLGVLSGHHRRQPPLFGYELDRTGAVTGVALRTPPFGLLLGGFTGGPIGPMLEAWRRIDPELPAVNGPPAIARRVAEAWQSQTGGSAHLQRGMAMHALKVVSDPPRRPAGELRRPRSQERGLLVDWWRGFASEADAPAAAHADDLVDAALATERIWLWDDSGPVSLVANSLTVAGVTRVGPVYTPPEHRCRGYAGMAVAEASRRILSAGSDSCMLFTDLANPTSNKIYAEVGYRRVADWEEYALTR